MYRIHLNSYVSEKMLNITHYQRNTNQNHNEVPFSRQSEWLRSKSLHAINAGEGVEKGEPFLTLLVGMQTGTATMENNVEIP